ncbi:YjfB family protein [Paenibacillus sp. NPDC058071]|uniref:YjfB family protein n=1 Tax=Paenibacillus sp. NPDC058071 TaxID=3346326 RepID=UPI0036DF9CEA
MDISALSIAMGQNAVKQAFSIGMLSKAMDSAEGQAAQLIQTMGSLDPNLGQKLDIKV